MFGISNPFGGGGGNDDSGSSSSSSSSSSDDSSTDDGGGGRGGGFFGGISDAVDDATDTVSDTVDDVTGGGSSSGGSPSRSRGGRSPSGSSRSSSSSSSSNSGGGGGGPLGGVGDTIDDVTDAARDTAEEVARDVDRTADRAQNAADDVTRDIDRTVDRTVNDVSSGARNAADEARDAAEDAAREAERAMDDARRTAGETAEDSARRARDAARDAADAADEASRRVDQTVDRASGTVDDVASGVSRSAGEVADAGRDQVDHAADTYGEMGRELQEGDVGGAVDTAVGSTGETFDNAARAADAAAGSTDEYVGSAEVNTEISDDLTRGGVLSETANDNSGLVSGFTYEPFGPDAPGLDFSEEGFRRASESVDSVKDSFDDNDPVTVMGSDAPERVLQGAAGAGVDLLNAPSHIMMAETGIEVAQNAPGEIQEHGFGEVAETATGVGAAVGGAMAREAKQNPLEFGSGTAFGFVTGVGLGRAASKAGKAADSARMRAGKQKVDMEDVTNPDTIDYYEGRNTDSENLFPGFDSRSGEAPDETIRRQGEEYTPDEVKQDLGPTAEDETYLTHMTNYDFDQSFEAGVPKSRPSDPDNAMFWGPEGSPNFAGFDPGEGTSTGMFSSLKPRLPRKSDFTADTNDALMSRMRVDVEPDRVGNEKSTRADPSGPEDFNDDGQLVTPGDESHFLSEEAEQGTAYVRNQNNRNLGEAETVVPGGSEFRELSSDYYSELGGELVNVRLFDPVDADRRGPIDETGGVLDSDIDDGGVVDETGGAVKTYDEIVRESGRSNSPEGTPVAPTFTTGTEGGASSAGGQGPVDPGTYGGPVDELGGFGRGFYDDVGTSSQPGTSSGGGNTPSPPPTSPPLDEFGPTSPTNSPPTSDPPSSGPPSSPPMDEFGPTSPPSSTPPSDPPSSGPTSMPFDELGPSSPPGSTPPSSGGPSSPPGSPPPWSPPGGYDGGGSSSTSPPGSPGGPGGSSGFGPSPFDPTQQQQRRRDFDDERKKDEEEFAPPAYGVFDVDFQNPIASGAQVLFGGGGFGGGFGGDGGALDETGGLQDAGFGDELSQGGPIDEIGGFDGWTPF